MCEQTFNFTSIASTYLLHIGMTKSWVYSTLLQFVYLFFCRTLPMSYIIHQRKILFRKTLQCDNVIVRTLASIGKLGIGMTDFKYSIPSTNLIVVWDKARYVEELYGHYDWFC